MELEKMISASQIMHETTKRMVLNYQDKDDVSFWEPRAMVAIIIFMRITVFSLQNAMLHFHIQKSNLNVVA